MGVVLGYFLEGGGGGGLTRHENRGCNRRFGIVCENLGDPAG